jgi:hypothetical protein
MKTPIVSALALLLASTSFAQSTDAVKCTVPGMKAEPAVANLLAHADEALRAEIIHQISVLGGTVIPESIEIHQKERGFFLNRQTSLSGTAKLTDGTTIRYSGQIDHYASKTRKYDSLGNDLGNFCDYVGYPDLVIVNAATKQTIAGVMFKMGPVSIKL